MAGPFVKLPRDLSLVGLIDRLNLQFQRQFAQATTPSTVDPTVGEILTTPLWFDPDNTFDIGLYVDGTGASDLRPANIYAASAFIAGVDPGGGGALRIGGNGLIGGDLSITGSLTMGDSSADMVTPNGRFDASLRPKMATSTYIADFVAANGTALTATTDEGYGWTLASGSAITIQSNIAVNAATSSPCRGIWALPVGSADLDLTLDCFASNNINSFSAGIVFRYTGNGLECYEAVWVGMGQSLVLYRTNSGGVRTSIGSFVLSAGDSTTPRVLRVTVAGSAINVYFDGVLKITVTDSTYTTGSIGIVDSGSISNHSKIETLTALLSEPLVDIGGYDTPFRVGYFNTLTTYRNATVGGTLGVTGAVTMAATLGVTGAATLSSTLAVTAAVTLTSASLSIGGLAYTFPASQAANRLLKTNGSGSLSWAQAALTTDVTGTLPVTNGGLGFATAALGDTIYGSGTNTLAKLAGNTTATKRYLTQTGTGSVSAAPAWSALTVAPSELTGFGAAGGYLRSDGAAWVRVSGLDVADLTGTTLPASIVTSSLTTIGTLVAGAVPASLVTAGTFGAGAYTFPSTLVVTSTLTTNGTITVLSSTATSASVQVGSGTGSGISQLSIYGAAGQTRSVSWRTGSLRRWSFDASPAAESGSDAGSNFSLLPYDDAGNVLSSVLFITRASGGAIAFSATRPITGGTYNGQTISSAASFTGTVAAVTSFTAPLLAGTTRVTSPLLGTTTNTDVTLDRNSVVHIKLLTSLALSYGSAADGAAYSQTYARDLAAASSIASRWYTTNGGVQTEAMRWTRDDLLMLRRFNVQEAAGIVLRLQNSSGTADVRTWDHRIATASGDYELRSITDGGSTVFHAMSVAHATGLMTVNGGISTALVTSAISSAAGTTVNFIARNSAAVDTSNRASYTWQAASSTQNRESFRITAGFSTTTDATRTTSASLQGQDAGVFTTFLTFAGAAATFPGTLVVGTDPGGSESLRVGGSVRAGTFITTNGLFISNSLSAAIELAAGTGTGSGGNVRMFGPSHATQANDIEFRSGAVVKGAWDDSAATWTFAGAMAFSGALSGITTLSLSGQLTSTLATGTAPLVVASTTKVANLNADLLDDQTGSYYLDLANATGTLDETLGGTGLTSYTLGDLLYASASNTLSKLAGNTSTTGMYLKQTGTGSASAAPVWDTLTAADVGAGTFTGSFSFSSLLTSNNGLLVNNATYLSAGIQTAGTSFALLPQPGSSTTFSITGTGSGGTDNKSISLGTGGVSTGAYLNLYGISHANAGRLDIASGGSAALTLTSASGQIECADDIDLASGQVLRVNGTQVVAAQGAAVADATGAGDVVAQLNALLARVRAHGLIAT